MLSTHDQLMDVEFASGLIPVQGRARPSLDARMTMTLGSIFELWARTGYLRARVGAEHIPFSSALDRLRRHSDGHQRGFMCLQRRGQLGRSVGQFQAVVDPGRAVLGIDSHRQQFHGQHTGDYARIDCVKCTELGPTEKYMLQHDTSTLG